ncbi:hypothetical protein V501_04785 [Pseudogymnoascus sp. VKM F-4519 (FW-2642)]|nr:hypothetical protein V501_04785 [Pseudogymnoascus sp. VKM F-4519 (FW-2642)]
MPSIATSDTHMHGPAGFDNSRKRADGESLAPTTDGRSRKRTRLTLACEECQVRKVKCDGQRPACTTCIARHGLHANCLYQLERATAAFSREHVERLERRIRDLQAGLDSRSGSPRHGATETGLPRQTSLLQNFPMLPPEHNSESHGQELDGMGNVSPTENGPASGVYGSSSTANFMRQLQDAVDEKIRTTGYPPRTGAYYGALDVCPPRPEERYLPYTVAQHCVLPPRHLADTMIEYFWVQGISLYPFLSKSSFNAAYQSLWSVERIPADRTMTYCTLNVVFAIASQFSHDIPLEMRESTADTYFKRAMQLLHFEILDSGSLQLIQALLIMGLYLQSTDEPHRCWVLIGIAIRVAQGLGLHLAETTARMERQSERELARRVWHGCILMDRILSTTLGRPLMISRAISNSVPLPASVDDEFLSSEPGVDNVQPMGVPFRSEFYLQTLKLYNILELTLSTFYPSGVSESVTSRRNPSTNEDFEDLDYNAILRIDKLLTEWHQDIPPHLIWRSAPMSGEVDELFLRQANVLKLRYLHLQILLFRPVLSQLLLSSLLVQKNHGPTLKLPLQHAIALPFARKCVSAAQQIIDITHGHQRNDGSFEPLPAWWYKVFYVYSAATVLVAARICRALHDDISDESLKTSWRLCLDILKRHTQVSKSARRCVAALEFLDRHILSKQLDGDCRQSHQETALSAVLQIPLPSAPAVDTAHDPHAFFLNEELQPEGGDFCNAVDVQDIAWLHSVPIDLMQFGTSNIFG